MLTVHPSIILGSFLWDEERLPRDEFEIRMTPLQTAIKQNGWAGAMVYGDAREHAALAYFSNFIPRMRWAMALFPATGKPLLLCSISSRDIPAMRTMTWIEDVKSGWEWQWFEQAIEHLPEGAIGTIGFNNMTPILTEGLTRRLGARFKLENADSVCSDARSTQRPREIATIRESAAILRLAADTATAALDSGHDAVSAALTAERLARSHAAHDVRTLISMDGGRTFHANTQRPERPSAEAIIYLAVKYLGYWSQTYVEHGASELVSDAARGALQSLIGRVSVGASLDRLAAGVQIDLGTLSPHPAISGQFGHRIGLSVCEGGVISLGEEGLVQPSTVYALQVGAVDATGHGSIATALVTTRQSGACDVIDRSWSGGA